MTREELGVLVDKRKKELKNSKFDYCEYFDEYEEFVKNNPCNTVESFANSDIWEVAKYLYQITEPIATLEENKETIDNFKSFFDGIDSDLCCGMMGIFDELCSLGIVDEVVDFFEESSVIKGLLKINKIDFKNNRLRNLIIDIKQVYKKDLPKISSFLKFYENDPESISVIMDLVLAHRELKKASDFTKDLKENCYCGYTNREEKRFLESKVKLYNKVCDAKSILNEVSKIRNLVDEQRSRASKYEKNIRKELCGYDKALTLLDVSLKRREITNAKEIIKNVKDEDMKKAFLKLIYEHNKVYYEELENEYNRLNQNDSNKYVALLQKYNISFTQEDVKEIMRRNNIDDTSEIINNIVKLNLTTQNVEILKHTSLDKFMRIKNLVDCGYISAKYLNNNEKFMWDESNLLDIYEENISYLDKFNLNPGMFINITDVIIYSFDIFSNNLKILNDYGLLKYLKNVDNLSFLRDINLVSKIDKFLELGYESFLENDLGILNLSNLKRLDILNSFNMPITDISTMYKVLSDQKFIIDDSKIDEYLPNVVELSEKKNITSNLSDFRNTNRVYSIGDSLFSINKINRLLESGNSLYDSLFMNRKFSEEEYDNILKALGCYTATK
ncbi:MAG: hypothetical protein PUG33_02540 [Mollicutes bacterium]|nr:hypothetical protein [Mollicutes bacterium]